MTDIWGYEHGFSINDLVGYETEAIDGHIGKVDEATDSTDHDHILVDTGFWVFGKKRLIPAGAISRIDAASKTVYLSMTKRQIKEAPDLHEEWDNIDIRSREDSWKEAHTNYYGPFIL
jgi:hypothetical protein